jgi:hypothetical protein
VSGAASGHRPLATAVLILLSTAAGTAGNAALRADADPRPFKVSVEEYVELHRRLRASLPALGVSSEPHQIVKASSRLAAVIREARPAARTGEFFNSVVAANFRARIHYALRDRDRRKAVVHLLTEVEEDEDERPPAGWTPAVNGTLDWFSTGATPHSILEALPDLPRELQYRFVRLDLVLLDVDANLIVDILPGAIPAE